MDYRNEWKGWTELPKATYSPDDEYTAKEGNTGRYPNYQKLLFKLTNELQPKSILEIGFNAGHSACCFLNAAPNAKMVTFDLCRWDTEQPALEVLQKYFDISLVKGDSSKTIPEFFNGNDVKFDLAFIDGGHTHDIPYKDMINTKNQINSGGLLIVDDFGVGSVTSCFNIVDWSDFEMIPITDIIEKDIRILRKK